jgi:outer membrane lipoprotein-sorting protein
MKLLRSAAVFGLLLAVSTSSARAQAQDKPAHPLKKAITIAKASLQKMKQIGDYQADLTKKEIVGGKAWSHKMKIKVRHEPFSVYLYFINPSKGREVLFVEGQNDGQLLAHEASGFASLVGTMHLSPTGRDAMKENRYPITKIGLVRSTEELIKQWEGESKFGETEVKYYPAAKIDNIQCKVIESTHPYPRKQFQFKTTRFWIDAKTNLPIRIEHFGWPKKPTAKPPLVAQYTYRNLKPNIGLTDRDFDKNNPRYSF